MKRTVLFSLWAGVLTLAATRLFSQTPLSEARIAIDDWVKTRQLISKAKSDWIADKETIEQSIQLFERELKTVHEQMAGLSTNTVQVDKERAEAQALLDASNASLDRAKAFVAAFEGKVVKMVPQLPMPLQDILKPIVARLPKDASNTTMGVIERIQVLVLILNELDKFNIAVNLFSEKRTNEKGEEVAVETVYVGLGAAYFVNDANDFAGTGTPGANGWEWTTKSDIAPAVREVIRIYRNERPARFVALPAVIR